MRKKILIFETHPVQYRAPVYQAIEKEHPGQIEVVYASDFSVRGYKDAGFGASFSWDVPLLSGYPNRVLGNETARGIQHWRGLTGRGVGTLIDEVQPNAVLLHSFSYLFDWAAYLSALRRRIPVWIRMETQDEAFERGKLKSWLRSLIYRTIYAGVSKAFYIGELNRMHLLAHGIAPAQLVPALYCTPDPVGHLSTTEKALARATLRTELGIPSAHVVVAFFGKLTPKKDPELIIAALRGLSVATQSRVTCLFVGSGELEATLREQARQIENGLGIRTVFAGFINQSRLASYYLASDVLVLPSRRMGETWGLVVNEGLQAGCSVVVSEAVGSNRNFGGWERVRVIPVSDAARLSRAIEELAALPRDFDWAREALRDYSISAAADSILLALCEQRSNAAPTEDTDDQFPEGKRQ